jgi:hypothetical protein
MTEGPVDSMFQQFIILVFLILLTPYLLSVPEPFLLPCITHPICIQQETQQNKTVCTAGEIIFSFSNAGTYSPLFSTSYNQLSAKLLLGYFTSTTHFSHVKQFTQGPLSCLFIKVLRISKLSE